MLHLRLPLLLLASLIGLTLLLATPAPARADEAAPNAADEAPPTPAFERLEVKIEPFEMWHEQVQHLRIDADGQCWYRIELRETSENIPGRRGDRFGHHLAPERIRRLNAKLAATDWLTAEGAEGRATHTHPTTITITLHRAGEQRTVVCHGERPAPYHALLLELRGLALQEHRYYDYRWSGEAADEAWREIGGEIRALRGEPRVKTPLPIDYQRYLPLAQQIVHAFYNRSDHELVPALRLVGWFRDDSSLELLHRMAHDRDASVRREVAWALRRIHDERSLPVLASMPDRDTHHELIRWGEEAVPHIVELIGQSTNASLEYWQRHTGAQLIRAYLDHGDELEAPIDPRVIDAVQRALENADPAEGTIRTEYHRKLLDQWRTDPPPSDGD